MKKTLLNLCIFASVRKKIIVSVTNDINTDQRVFKVCQSLQKMGFEVSLIGRLNSWSKPLKREYYTHRINNIFKRGPLFYIEFNVRLFFLILFKPCSALLSNDLDTLPANYFAAKIKNISLIYDSHELFTEVPELVNRPFKRRIWQSIESSLLPKLNQSYTVCDSISDHYKNSYNIQMKVIKNVPISKGLEPIPKTKTIIYQGNMNPARGIDLIISCMKYLPDFELKIIGNGPGYSLLKQLAESENVADRVIFFGRLPYDKMQKHTQEASIGILFEEPFGLSFEYSLPNKLFDYIHAHTPVLSTPLVEVKKVLAEFSVGELLENREPKNVSKQILRMVENQSKYSFESAIKTYNWQNEEKVLKTIFL